MKNVLANATSMVLLPIALFAQHAHQNSEASPYAGFESREIKSLSEEDIEELRRGGGWGLALPAELNGKPGPAHLLELSDALALSDGQIAQITMIFDDMQTEAISVGERLIEAERELSKAFEVDDLGMEELKTLVRATEAARAELRFVHLSRHLSTVPLLTNQQLNQYQVLRGYASDPCSQTPEGHDPDMWKKHNGCL